MFSFLSEPPWFDVLTRVTGSNFHDEAVVVAAVAAAEEVQPAAAVLAEGVVRVPEEAR
jgi:hypothetical protein